MPNSAGPGPDGKGPTTGFGRGYCVMPISSSEQELKFLRNQERVLQAQLREIRNRIKRLKTKKEVHHARI
jgi:hypothetical protein